MIILFVAYTGCCLYEPRDCQDVKESGFTESGVYSVTPGGTHTSFDVFCEMSTNNETWLVKYFQLSEVSYTFNAYFAVYCYVALLLLFHISYLYKQSNKRL